MQIEKVGKAAPPALAHSNRSVERGAGSLGDSHDADPRGIDARVGPQVGEGCEGVALHLGGRDQGLIGDGAAHAPAAEAVDDQGRHACIVEGLCIIMLAVALNPCAAGQNHHAGKSPGAALWQMQAR